MRLDNLRAAGRAIRESVKRGVKELTIPVPAGQTKPRARLLVGGGTPAVEVAGGRASLEIASLLDHEAVVLE